MGMHILQMLYEAPVIFFLFFEDVSFHSIAQATLESITILLLSFLSAVIIGVSYYIRLLSDFFFLIVFLSE